MRELPVIIPYFDEKEEQAAIMALRSGWVAQGPKVAEFEAAIAKHEGVKYGVATTSCTTALHLAMLVEGVKKGFDVIVPSFTFVATANTVVENDATPIIVDIKQEDFTIDPVAIENKISNCYSAENGKLVNKDSGNVLWGILAVHQFGLCADMPKINEIAKKHGIKVIEDAACALGAKIDDKHQGSFGNTSCISFHPRKSISTGEGGMILSNDETLVKRMKELRSHGSTVSADARHAGKGFLLPEFHEAGFNYRMTDIQGAIGLAQAEKLDFILSERSRRAQIYNELISKSIPELITPSVPKGYFHSYQSYVCMLNLEKYSFNSIEDAGEYRNTLLDKLEQIGIQTRQGTHAVHMLDYYKNRFGFKSEDLPNAYACDRLSIALPLYVQMSDDDQEYVVLKFKELVEELK